MQFSIVIPIFRPNISHLSELIETILVQNYDLDNIEIIFVEDLFEKSFLEFIVSRFPKEFHLKTIKLSSHLGIAGASNYGARMAQGEYLIFVDQDDLMAPNALWYLDIFIQSQTKQPVFVHSEYTNISNSGTQLETVRCPDWSPIRLLGSMYAAHLKVVLRSAFLEINGFNSAFDGAQDYDLLLRLSEVGEIANIKKVLYFWRESDTSSQSNPAAKPHIPARSQQLVQDHLDRKGILARSTVLMEHPTFLGLRFPASEASGVSIVIPSAFANLPNGKIALLNVLSSLTQLSNQNIEIVCVVDSQQRALIEKIESQQYLNIRWVFHDMKTFNFSSAVNLGFEAAIHDVLITLNDDVEFLNDDWLDQVIGYLSMKDVGVVGAKMYYPDGTIQHIGIGIDSNNHCYHPMAGEKESIGHLGEGLIDHEVDAVTGAFLATTRQHWNSVGRFNQWFPNNYNDVVFCMKTWALGKSVVIANSIQLIHHESLTRLPQRTDLEIQKFTDFANSLRIEKKRYTLTLETLPMTVGRHFWIKKIWLSIQYRGMVGFIKNSYRKLRYPND